MTRPDTLRIVSLCGLLGYGYPPESLRRAMALQPDVIGVDAGSTDPGPYYLGSGTSFVSPEQVRRDLEPALCAAVKAGVPLVVGTAGGCGAKPHLEQALGIVRDIARSNDLHFKLAVIPADIDTDLVIDALHDQRLSPCGFAPELTEEAMHECTRIVGQMGVDPIIRALEDGAEVVLAGRACDTAVFAAEPIRRGFDAGLALHLGKIMECGTLCARPAGACDVMVGTLGPDYFDVVPANPARGCNPDSVAAHSLYEQPDPNCFYEPEGKVDLSGCTFEAIDDRTVRVRESRLEEATEPTIKLEGARPRGYRTVTVAGIRDPGLIAHLDEIEQSVRQTVTESMDGDLSADLFSLQFIRYGLDGVTGGREIAASPPHEVGLVIEAIAPTQALADRVLKLARSTALHQHYDGRKTTAGNLAFPFSPSDLSGGEVYEFGVYHLLHGVRSQTLFPVHMEAL